MTTHNTPAMGICVSCKQTALGQSYNFFRKDAVKVEELSGFQLPGQHTYRINYHTTSISSFVCNRCIRRNHVWSIVRFCLCLTGLGLSLFLLFYKIATFPEGRFFGLILSLYTAWQSFISLIILAGSKDGVNMAMKQARYDSIAKGEKHTIAFVKSIDENLEMPR